MHEYNIKIKKMTDKDIHESIEKPICQYESCKNQSVAFLRATKNIASYACNDHVDKLFEAWTEIDRMWEFLSPNDHDHPKIKYFEPQPVPSEIQILLKKVGLENLDIYAVDKRSLNGIKSLLQSKYIEQVKNKEVSEGEFTVFFIEEWEN